MADEAQNVSRDWRHVASLDPRNRKRQRLAISLIGLAMLVLIGILVAGYTVIFVLPSRQVVARVGEVEYTRGDMMTLMRVKQKTIEALGGQFAAGTDIFLTLQLIVENEIVAQAAPRFGITVSDALIDAQIRGLLARSGQVSLLEMSDQAEREFRERYNRLLNSIQLSEKEHRALVRRGLLRELFKEFIGESVPLLAEHVRLHRVIGSLEEEADIMRVKLKDALDGVDDPETRRSIFKEIARELSQDTQEVLRRGGDLGWVPRGVNLDYEDSFFDLEVGELSDPVQKIDDPTDYYFFMVSERAPARELSPASRDALKVRALQDWLNEERKNYDVWSKFDSFIYNWMIEQLKLTSSSTPEGRTSDNPLGF